VAEKAQKTVATNRRARHDYEIVETVEAGLVLLGSEIKSVRAGRVSLQEAFVVVEGGEAWLNGAHIAPYEHAGYAGHESLRRRKLLLHRRQIARFGFQAQAKGFTLVPLRMYLTDGRAKLELGLGRGKKQYDRREDIRKRDVLRDLARAPAPRPPRR
jgi:SsrA-binding protein